jgi:hypothetical protein
MTSFYEIPVVLLCAVLGGCQMPGQLARQPRPADVISVGELEHNRERYQGRIVRVEGFLQEIPQGFIIIEGRSRELAANSQSTRYASWCLVLRPNEPLWIERRELANRWRSIRPRNRHVGIHVIVEGVFADEHRPPSDEQGRSNATIVMGARHAVVRPEEYVGMGPLRNVRLLRVFSDRCEGSGP